MYHERDSSDPKAYLYAGSKTFADLECANILVTRRRTPPTVSLHGKESFNRQYKVGKLVGEANATVNLVKERKTGEIFVVKSSNRSLLDEANLIAALRPHPNIGEIHKAFYCPDAADRNTIYRLVMPYYNGGDLENFVENLMTTVNGYSTKVPEAFIWSAFREIAAGIHFLHNNNRFPALHADLKPSNVMLQTTRSGYPTRKIVDFGISDTVTAAHYYPAGSYAWSAPEYPTCSTASDVYGIGAIIHYLISGEKLIPHCTVPDAEVEDVVRWRCEQVPHIRRITRSTEHDWTRSDNHKKAARTTFESSQQLPYDLYSPLLAFWTYRTLENCPALRATSQELVSVMSVDAKRLIKHQQKYISKVLEPQGQRPMNIMECSEPPPHWSKSSPPAAAQSRTDSSRAIYARPETRRSQRRDLSPSFSRRTTRRTTRGPATRGPSAPPTAHRKRLDIQAVPTVAYGRIELPQPHITYAAHPQERLARRQSTRGAPTVAAQPAYACGAEGPRITYAPHAQIWQTRRRSTRAASSAFNSPDLRTRALGPQQPADPISNLRNSLADRFSISSAGHDTLLLSYQQPSSQTTLLGSAGRWGLFQADSRPPVAFSGATPYAGPRPAYMRPQPGPISYSPWGPVQYSRY